MLRVYILILQSYAAAWSALFLKKKKGLFIR
jgi:hypothetical protein